MITTDVICLLFLAILIGVGAICLLAYGIYSALTDHDMYFCSAMIVTFLCFSVLSGVTDNESYKEYKNARADCLILRRAHSMTFIEVAKVAKNMGKYEPFLALRECESWKVGSFLEKLYGETFIITNYANNHQGGDLTIDDYLADDWYMLSEGERIRAKIVADKLGKERTKQIIAEWEEEDIRRYGKVSEFTKECRKGLESA